MLALGISQAVAGIWASSARYFFNFIENRASLSTFFFSLPHCWTKTYYCNVCSNKRTTRERSLHWYSMWSYLARSTLTDIRFSSKNKSLLSRFFHDVLFHLVHRLHMWIRTYTHTTRKHTLFWHFMYTCGNMSAQAQAISSMDFDIFGEVFLARLPLQLAQFLSAFATTPWWGSVLA